MANQKITQLSPVTSLGGTEVLTLVTLGTPNVNNKITAKDLGISLFNINVTFGEVPTGTINGTNLIFTLANSPSPVTALLVILNGLILTLSGDYTLSGNTITFISGCQPRTGDVLRATYVHG